MTSLLLMAASGFVTWTLALGRSLAWDGRRVYWLIIIVFADELIGIRVGQYLARSQSLADATAVAIGGTVAAAIMVAFKQRGKR